MEEAKKMIVRSAKILSPDNLSDRFSVAYEYVPENQDERNFGSLYFIIEIMRTDEIAQEIAQKIVSTMIDEFYHNLYLDQFTSFELGLKKVNEELAQIAESNNLNWYGKLNSVIATFAENSLHLTQTGNAEAYLVRANSVSHISQGLSSPGDRLAARHPFVNIASGNLSVNDKIFLASSELLNHISLEKLRKYASEGSPAVVANNISKQLKKEGVVAVDTLILEATTDDLLSMEAPVDLPDEVWLEEPKKIAETLIKLGKNYGSKAWTIAKKTAASILSFSKEKGVPALITAAKSGASFLKNKYSSIRKSADKKSSKDIFAKTSLDSSATKPAVIKEKIKDKHLTKTSKKLKVLNVFSNYLDEGKNLISPLIAKIGLSPSNPNFAKNSKRAVIASIAILLVIFAVSLTFLGVKERKEIKQVKASINFSEAWDKEKSAEAAIHYNDKTKARKLFNEALALAEKADPKKQSDEYQKFAETVQNKLYEMDNIFKLKPSAVLDLSKLEDGGKASGLFLYGNSLYSFTNKSKIILGDTLSGKITTISDSSSIGHFAFGTKTPDGLIVYYTESKDVRIFDPNTKSTEVALTMDQTWKNAVSISSYASNIYLLDPDSNQIWKYIETVDGYSVANDYIKDETKISTAVSIAIDGYIYVLNGNGSIVRFSQGFGQPFAISGLPTTLSDKLKFATLIYTTEDLDQIYLVDAGLKRIIEIDKEGNYKRQWVADIFSNIQGLTVDPVAKVLYVLADNKIYDIDLAESVK